MEYKSVYDRKKPIRYEEKIWKDKLSSYLKYDEKARTIFPLSLFGTGLKREEIQREIYNQIVKTNNTFFMDSLLENIISGRWIIEEMEIFVNALHVLTKRYEKFSGAELYSHDQYIMFTTYLVQFLYNRGLEVTSHRNIIKFKKSEHYLVSESIKKPSLKKEYVNYWNYKDDLDEKKRILTYFYNEVFSNNLPYLRKLYGEFYVNEIKKMIENKENKIYDEEELDELFRRMLPAMLLQEY